MRYTKTPLTRMLGSKPRIAVRKEGGCKDAGACDMVVFLSVREADVSVFSTIREVYQAIGWVYTHQRVGKGVGFPALEERR